MKIKKNSKDRLIIGYISESQLNKSENVSFIVREVKSPKEMKQVVKLCFDTYGEVDFIEDNKWYDVRKMNTIVAVNKNKVLGFASWKKEKDRLFLLVILTVPKYFRQGIGTALINKIKNIAQKLRLNKIFVPISNDDLVSYVFYHKNGFKLSGIDIGLPEKRHGKEEIGFWGLPCRNEFYLEYIFK